MKMWDGRFDKSTASLMERFHASLPFDRRLYSQDIAGSVAWARALCSAGVLTREECDKIEAALPQIARKIEAGPGWSEAGDEDIHMAIERLLTNKIGATGARLHTGRSRNDQVATDMRLYCKEACAKIAEKVRGLQQVVYERADSDREVIMAGYTHLQQAQPVSLAHYWLSLFWRLSRELDRLGLAITSADICVLGSGALAGSGVPVDRDMLARELGFGRVGENSMDGVASRDFVLDLLAAVASIGITLSRYAEDLIIWSSAEFGYIELDDAWATGSSMMPQKKNPDSLELIRGKAGRFIGNYTRLAATLKGVGLTYYKDLQEDKETAFDSVDQIQEVLEVFSRCLATLHVNPTRTRDRMDSLLLATDLADYLVGKGVPFRQAHQVVGKVVGYALRKGVSLFELQPADLCEFCDQFQDDVGQVLSWQAALSHRDSAGGTGPQSVAAQLAMAAARLQKPLTP